MRRSATRPRARAARSWRQLRPALQVYAAIRARLEAAGRPIGGNDYLIAAQALTMDCTLVTDNVQEFRCVPNLSVESWLR